MEKFYLKVHSVIDVITNSSTEIFMLETKKTIDIIQEIITEVEREYPPETYGVCNGSAGHATVEITEDWEISEAFGYINEDEAIKYLKAKGYEFKKIENKNNYLCIKAERGYMNSGLRDFINKTFNVVYTTTDG